MKKHSILTRGQQIANTDLPKANTMDEVEGSGPTGTGELHKVRKRLFQENTDETDDDSKRKFLLDSLHCKMQIYKRQKMDLEKCGNLSAARRKRRRIVQYKEAIDKVDRGEEIDIDNLPDPDPDPEQTSPIYTNYQPAAEVPAADHKIDEKKKCGKKQNYCLYCEKLVKEYSVHIERHHPDSAEGKALLAIEEKDGRLRGQLKKKITDVLRKKANAIYNEKILKENESMNNEIILVKNRHKKVNPSEDNTRACLYCKGWYRKDRMSVHLKRCQQYLNRDEGCSSISGHLVKEHSLPILMIGEIRGASKELKQEVLKHMNNDEVKKTALQDSLIMRFGSEFHRSRRERIHWNYTASKIRDLTNLLISIQKINPTIKTFNECCNPANFQTVVEASLNLSGYDPSTGTLKIPSMAYRLCHPLKIAVSVAMSDVLCAEYENESQDLRKYKMYKHFLQLIDSQWASRLGRIATRIRKEAQAGKVQKFALEEDIVKLCNFIIGKYRTLVHKLNNEVNKDFLYDELMEMIICHIMCLIRRRPVDFRRATLTHYKLLDRQDDLLEMVKGRRTDKELDNNSQLETTDIDKCKNFHIFYVPGKNLEIVPIVLTPLMKDVMDCLIKYRDDVGIRGEAERLFVFSAMREVNPAVCLTKVKKNINLKSPNTFTGNGLRHQAATFSRLHSQHPQYQDFLASALGHSLVVHKKHYDLPTSILQKLIVCPILHKMTVGKGHSSQLEQVEEEAQSDNDPHSDPSTEELIHPENPTVVDDRLDEKDQFTGGESKAQKSRRNKCTKKLQESSESEFEANQSSNSESESPKSDLEISSCDEEGDKRGLKKGKFLKQRWTLHEQKLVFGKFEEYISTRTLPPRSDVVIFFNQHKHELRGRSLQSMYTYLHNLISRKQKNVSPMIKKVLNRI